MGIFVNDHFPVVGGQRPRYIPADPLRMSYVKENVRPACGTAVLVISFCDDLHSDLASGLFGNAAAKFAVEVFLSHLQACRDDFDLLRRNIGRDVVTDVCWAYGQLDSSGGRGSVELQPVFLEVGVEVLQADAEGGLKGFGRGCAARRLLAKSPQRHNSPWGRRHEAIQREVADVSKTYLAAFSKIAERPVELTSNPDPTMHRLHNVKPS